MLIIIETVSPSNSYPMELPDDEDIELLTQMIQVELGIPREEQELSMNGRRLGLSGSFHSCGIVDGSVIIGMQTTCYPDKIIYCRY